MYRALSLNAQKSGSIAQSPVGSRLNYVARPLREPQPALALLFDSTGTTGTCVTGRLAPCRGAAFAARARGSLAR
jgi:hypothetical protein